MKKVFSFVLLGLLVTTAYAQRETNKEELRRIAVEQSIAWEEATARAIQYAAENNITLRTEYEDGTVVELVDVINGLPVYNTTDNIGAAATTHASNLWENPNFGGGITGAGFNKVAIWDGGRVRTTHREFNNTGVSRVTTGDNASISDHATHVAGTIIAGGVSANAKGMAFEALLKCYDWNNVENEMITAATNGFTISNHSWGHITGWNQSDNGSWTWTGEAGATEDYRFGYYNNSARSWDNICYNAPYFLIVKSAGNNRSEGPSYAGTEGHAEVDGGEDGYDCISSMGVAKNIMTVGAVKKVSNYNGPGSVAMTYFSDWGPADDGRIKPDIVGCGYSVYSAGSSNDSNYSSKNGTSMSTPNVTGSLVLLHQYYEQLYGETMRSATIKALAIHTADECGPDVGPDYMFGWGLLNVEKGATIINKDIMQNTIDELVLNNAQTYERTISVSANEPLRVTICWTDPQGPVHAPVLNNRASVLINDLDLKIVDAANNVYYPYSLNPDNPSAAATTSSTNNVDNVEQVYIETPTTGNYKIVVTHKGSLQGGSQAFSLISSYQEHVSSDATLVDIVLDKGILTPGFNFVKTEYTVNVPYDASNITITGVANNENATIVGNGTKSLNVGDNTFNIVVTSENGANTMTYTLVVTRLTANTHLQITATVNGEGGSIEPSGVIQILQGESQTFAINPDYGHAIVSVLVNGVNNLEAIEAGSYTFEDIADNHTIEVTFEQLVYTITSTTGAGGTINPKGTITLNYGENQTYVFEPRQDYRVNTVLVDGVNNPSAVAAGEYTFENITEDHTIRVTFIKGGGVGIDDIENEEELILYPNPTNDKFTVKTAQGTIKRVQMYNLSGRLLLEEQVNANTITVDLSNYAAGIYILNVDGKQLKVVKQ